MPGQHYICIHGHFYQPPRENPWLEEIELQDSAYPFHDWNDRINTECYAANAMSRVLDEQGRIARIVNNYSRISFNFGPTLLAWIEDKDPATYRRILEADQHSRERFSGHGSAVAQAYNHMILPLATRRDKVTQVKWGIADFVKRFGRQPEGMWLPETAVDTETLEVLAEEGIKYTILAPRQADRYRPLRKRGARKADGGADGEIEWRTVENHHIDATRAYVQRLPSGKSINLFFYDGPISQGIAFEQLLTSGSTFSERLLGALPSKRDRAYMVNIATDGETYGHHHRHGDMALAYALELLDYHEQAELTNYGEFLARHPPTQEVQVLERSSWSCVHGVGRWCEDCGCNTGGHGDWNQAWRKPLREGLDWLRDEVTPRMDAEAAEMFKEPMAAMHDYIHVILDRSPENVQAFLSRHCHDEPDEAARVTALRLMELHRHLQLMYTSCGWFFDELSGIETVQVMHYAARAIAHAQELFHEDLETGFVDRLEQAVSNLPEHGNGRQIYDKWVRPAKISLVDVAGHYALSSLFPLNDGNGSDDEAETRQIFCFAVDADDHQIHTSWRTRLALGRARISSLITHEASQVVFGALHLGDHNLMGSAREAGSAQEYETLLAEAKEAFDRADFPETIRVLDRHFGEEHRYTVMSVFRDDQRRILDHILNTTIADIERAYRQVYQTNVPLMRSLSSLGAPLPRVLRTTAEFVVNWDLRRAFTSFEDGMELEEVKRIIDEARTWGIELDTAGLSFALQRTMEALADELAEHPGDAEVLERLDRVATLAEVLPFEVNLWKTQNVYYDLGRAVFEAQEQQRLAEVVDSNGQWLEHFRVLGEKLHVGV